MHCQTIDTLGLEVDVRFVDADRVYPFHGVASEERYEKIKESLAAEGWNGTPIPVFDGDLALGGAHRIAAAQDLGMEIPVVKIGDLIRAAGENPSEYGIEDRDDAIEALGVVPGISEFA